MDMAGIPSESSEYHSEFVLRYKSRACRQWFKNCLETPSLDSDDWLEQKAAVFNWWMSGLNADKSGPDSLDAWLRLRPDVREVLVDVLDGLGSTLCKLHQMATSDLLFEENPEDPTNNTRSPSPWSDMSDSNIGNSSLSSSREEGRDQETGNNASLAGGKYHEQRVYIDTHLQTLIRIHTAIRRSGLKFKNHYADEALKRAEEAFQSEKMRLGEHQALWGQHGGHERFRRYLTKLVLWNGYTHDFVQRMGYSIHKLAETCTPQDKQYSELLLQKKLLIVICTYLYDEARLTTVQRRLVNANVIRRNRLIHAGKAAKASFGVQNEHQAQLLTQGIVHQVISADQTQPTAHSITPNKSKRAEDKEDEPSKSSVAQPATGLDSRSSITAAPAPPRATKSAATDMTARVGHLDYPKCPVKHGQFPCLYCSIMLPEEYNKKEKWRTHVAQDLCAYICVFEDCESSDEMFASTYEWMSHMARFHCEIEWVCRKCTQYQTPGVEDAFIFQDSALLREHILASHQSLDLSELDLRVEAGKQSAGIQKARCPLCRPGLVSLGEDDDMAPPLSDGHEMGLVRLEEDEHIATHIHEFALHSFPFPEETSETSETSQALSHSESSPERESNISPLSTPVQMVPFASP
ncbi:hypothetical protein GGR55DRAFT_397189 [Xylaria sp. FL0064]|nr:hypothetical protein GGR55DRAFT_397189 [Xylaria sp. FL0064]